MAIVLPWSCRPSSGRPAIVSGKTVFEKAAVEGAAIEVQAWEDGGWKHHSSSRSGYHGSFRLELPAGRYRLLAAAILPGPGGRRLEGVYQDLVVEAGRRRDRLVIPLSRK